MPPWWLETRSNPRLAGMTATAVLRTPGAADGDAVPAHQGGLALAVIELQKQRRFFIERRGNTHPLKGMG